MLWSRIHGSPPGLRNLPLDDRPPRPAPLLTQPFAGGATGWVVVFGAVVAEVAGGAVVANQTSAAVVVPVLISPVLVVFGFAFTQWWQARSWGAEPASWWHLAGVAAAALTWLLWPDIPGAVAGTGALPCSSSRACHVLTQPLGHHDAAWWCTGILILAAGLLARRSRIAAWAAIPAAFAGCGLATYFLG
jgi:hypothetical protein